MKTSNTRNTSIRQIMIAAAIATVGLTAARTSAAADAAEPLRMSVSYADLNIGTPSGAHQLYSRLESAAERVCAPLDGRTGPMTWRFQACYRNALDSAVAKINQPALTAMHIRAQAATKG